MKNFKAIFWLMCFFPIGVYFMFKQTTWSKKIKWITAILGSLLLGGLALDGLFYDLIFISGFLTILSSVVIIIYSVFRKKQLRSAVLVLLLGFLLTGFSFSTVNKKAVEAERIAYEEQLELEKTAEKERLEQECIADEARIEQDRLAEEERLEAERLAEKERLEAELLAEKEKQRKIEELEERYLDLATWAITRVESHPTRNNFERAHKLILDSEDPNEDLLAHLDGLEQLVIDYETELQEAEIALFEAEENNNRSDYDEAYALITNLKFNNRNLSNRLSRLNTKITEIEEKAEEERLAKEEADRIAKEKAAQEKAEQERVAQEKVEAEKRAAEQKAAQEAQASQSSGGNSGGSSSGGSSSGNNSSSGENFSSGNSSSDSTVSPPPQQTGPPSDDVTKIVYIAPQSGTKYHYRQNCRGLSNANSIAEISLANAKAQGYDLCGWEK